MFEIVDLFYTAGFGCALFVLNKLVIVGAFDFVNIKFSYKGNKKTVTTDKEAWIKFGTPVSVALVALYFVYRIVYQ